MAGEVREHNNNNKSLTLSSMSDVFLRHHIWMDRRIGRPDMEWAQNDMQ